uniref:Uncharacterized protein n=1 Tax=Meloidogyne enterolobii TaxID=390850 RepID=A0A6V7WR28_MELEN|nr:unnamed protein product [Meloidogyne enterolobii]
MKKSLSISLFYFLQFASNVLGKNFIESSLHESIDANEAQVENDSEGGEEKYFSLNLLDNKLFDFASGLEPLSEIILDESVKNKIQLLENNSLLKQYDNLKISLLYYRGELADILEMINDQLNLKVKLQVKILFLVFLNHCFKLWELK